ncbi:MAG: sporulation integral membrane protein YtvI [Lachnospiraceae bacterium]|nr:sporulation integral membrane protein YtvI [Lachnospiraceae bacterium]
MKFSTKYLKIFCNLLTAGLILWAFFYLLPRVLRYFAPFVVGFVLSVIANPIVRFLEKRIRIKRKYGSVVLISLVIALLILACYGLGSALAAGLRSFADYLPTMTSNAGSDLSTAAGSLQEILNRIPLLQGIDLNGIGEIVGSFVNNLISGSSGNSSLGTLTDVVKHLPDILIAAVMGLLATYFFIADHDQLRQSLREHLPEATRTRISTLYQQVVGVVVGYFKAQFKIMGVIYVILLIGLMLLRIKFAWLIAFGIAFLDMLPVFGTGTVLIPWAVVEVFLGNYGFALGLLLIYVVALVVHQGIQPAMVGGTIGMDPFLTLFFMYIGYKVNSVLGMILAIPIGMILINLYKAGAFDTWIWCVKEIVHDFNEFRRIDRKE